ncbi:DUF1405 domain-containing protein [Terrilactibacillus laevilacticus]|nr:DUF1405 domain-containing protein [Terrilactibacillus laevilacticus]
MTLLYYLMKQKYFLIILLIINGLGTVYGFWWYKFQLKDTPYKYLIFVPDSPMATLFFCIAILFILFHRRSLLFEGLAMVSLVKYGLWAVGMNAVSAHFGYPIQTTEIMLMISHGFMAIEGVLFAKFFNFKKWQFALASLWLFHNDFIDYIFGMAPWYPYLKENMKIIGYCTFWLSVISLTSIYMLTKHQVKYSIDFKQERDSLK